MTKRSLLAVMTLVFVTLACSLTSSDNDAAPTSIVLPPITITSSVGLSQEGTSTIVPATTITPIAQITATPFVPACSPRTDWTVFYTVEIGDTLSDIATRSGTTAEALAAGNCLFNPDMLTVGQSLRVPHQPSPRVIVPTTDLGPSCATPWFFAWTATALAGCPTILFSGTTTAQDFEGGRAFDYPIAATDGQSYIFVLYNDGSYDYFVDSYTPGMPLDFSNLPMPSGRYAPEGSIGYLWLNNQTVRTALGWAFSPLENFIGRWQFWDSPSMGISFPPVFPGWTVFVDYGKSGLVLRLTEQSAGMGGRVWEVVGGY